MRPSDPAFRTLCTALVWALLGCDEASGERRAAIDAAFAEMQGDASPAHPGPMASSTLLVNRARESGIDCRWSLRERGVPSVLEVTESIGNGVGFIDVDDDGRLDVLCVADVPTLFRNIGEGRFERTRAIPALPPAAYSGVAAADYDRDGRIDLYLSAYRGGALLRNEGGRFALVAGGAGIPPQRFGTSASFSDLNGDGWVDLVIGNYLVYDRAAPLTCQSQGVGVACGPESHQGENTRVYMNRRGHFEDASAALGVLESFGKSLAVLASDLDADGSLEVVLANDGVAGDLFTLGDAGFTNIGVEAGIAYTAGGGPYAGMGIDAADFDRDGLLDVIVTANEFDGAHLFRQVSPLRFREVTASRGDLRAASARWVGWGVRFADFDNDGWSDLLIANGHFDSVGVKPRTTFTQPLLLFHNGGGTFRETPASLHPSARHRLMGRGVATGDYDGDGRIDVVASDGVGHVLLLRNETPDAGNWLSIDLRRKDGSIPHGVVAHVSAGGRRTAVRFHNDGSFLSVSDPAIHVGLGAATQADSISVTWPTGRVETYGPVAANRRVRLREETGLHVD